MELPFDQRIRKAAELGFEHVEMWFVDGTFKGSAQQLAGIAHSNGVTITNTVIGSPDGAVGGGLTDPAKRQEWLQRASATIAFTKGAGIGASIVCTGNIVEGMTEEATLKSVLDGLEKTVELGEAAGVTLLLEPLNTRYDHAGYWLDSSDKGAEICRTIGSSRLRLLYDCYHMQIMEGDLVKHIERNLDVIGHFHSAGAPGRNELYRGEVNYPFVLERITQFGYQGVFAMEYTPSQDDESSVAHCLEYLKTGSVG